MHRLDTVLRGHKFVRGFAHYQDGTARFSQDLFRDRAEKDVVQAVPTVRTHHDQVHGSRLGEGKDCIRHITFVHKALNLDSLATVFPHKVPKLLPGKS